MSVSKQKQNTTQKLCMLAMLIAITAILAIYGTFRIGNTIKIPTKFISVFITGVWFGPWMAGVVAVSGDMLNAFLAPVGPWMPQVTCMEFLSGFVFGMFFYQKPCHGKSYVIRTFGCALLQTVLDLVLMTWILTKSGIFPDWRTGFFIRLGAGIIKMVMQTSVLLAGMKYLPVLEKACGRKTFQSYANSFQTVSRLGLERIGALLEELGNPQNKLNCIHIAGTNGKGSVAAFLQTILTKAGYKTGKYISPNMDRVNERISIDGMDIPDPDLETLLKRLENVSKAVQKKTGEIPTQFEIWTAAAFAYFAAQGCDYVVLETGLGGRFDATNIIEKNVLSILTGIDIDHTEYLGDTIEKIAAEKAGILKKGSVVITAEQLPAAEAVIKKRAEELEIPVITAKVPKPEVFTEIYENFRQDSISCTLSLGGVHQLENAAIAVCAAKEFGISATDICYGLSNTRHPGRFELLAEDLLYDGAHNPDGVRALVSNLERYFPEREKIYIMASMQDKDITENLLLLSKTHASFRFVAVQNNPRSATAQQLKAQAAALGLAAEAFDSLEDALKGCGGKLRVVCGSLYLYHDLGAKYRKLG